MSGLATISYAMVVMAMRHGLPLIQVHVSTQLECSAWNEEVGMETQMVSSSHWLLTVSLALLIFLSAPVYFSDNGCPFLSVTFFIGFAAQTTNKTNSVALSPRANYTDCVTTTCQQNLVPTFVDKGVSRGQHGGSPTVVNLSLDLLQNPFKSDLHSQNTNT
jgi:hypothetical protein